MATDTPRLRTAGVLAGELNAPLRRVLRILASRPHIRPCGLAGTLRLYSAHAVAQVRYELNLQDARRCRKGVPS